jgi:hypothetical protein
MLSLGRHHKTAALVLFAALVLLALASTAGVSYGLTPVTDYNCPNDNSNNGHYVPANHYWEEEFTAAGTSITGGYLLLGANEDGGDHVAKIGVYTGTDRSGTLEEIEQQVVGYGGVSFTFPTPITVSPGQQLHIAATGVGDFTAYDERPSNGEEGCFIGRIEGYAASVGEELPRTESARPQEEAPPASLPETPPAPHKPSGNPAVAHFSRKGAVTWANNHVGSHPYFGEDCTDFVSQAWNRGGGLSQQPPWWFFDEEPLHFSWLGHTYSKNWAAVENFANEMAAHHWVERTTITNLSVKTIPGAELGDVVLWHEPKQPTYWSHVALIIGTTGGTTRIDQHSPPKRQTVWNEKWQKDSLSVRKELRVQLLHVETG